MMGDVFKVLKKTKSNNEDKSNNELLPTKVVCVKFVKVLEKLFQTAKNQNNNKTI